VKEKKISMDHAKTKVMMAAIHDKYKVYCGKQFSDFNTQSYPELLDMIRLLRQKKIDKDAEADELMLGEREIEIFNHLEVRGDRDKEPYNKQIYERYLSKFVNRGANMNENTYRLPEIIKPNYVTPQQVRKMIDDKYRRGSFNIKSEDKIKKLYEVAENVFKNMEDPLDSMKTISAKDYDLVFANKLYKISSNINQQQLNSIINNNMKIEEKIANLPSNTTSIPTSFFNPKKEEDTLPGEGEETETEGGTESATETEYDTSILPENPNRAVQDNSNTKNFAPYQTKA
jgi:hypothetical protein